MKLMINPNATTSFEIELDKVAPAFKYVNGERTNERETDPDTGKLIWNCDCRFYEKGATIPVMSRRVKVAQDVEPSISTRHGYITFEGLSVNLYGTDKASLRAIGVKEVQPQRSE